jgi:hypothetical protein
VKPSSAAKDYGIVRNAADEGQLKEAGERQEGKREQEQNDLAFVMSTVQGRRFLWRVIKQCKTFSPVWENSARIHYNAGQHEVGIWLWNELEASNAKALLQMYEEAMKGAYDA